MDREVIYLEENASFVYKKKEGNRRAAASIVSLLVAYLLVLCLGMFWNHSLLYATQSLIFLIAGVLHLVIINRSFPAFSNSQQWVFTSGLSAVLLLFMSISFFWGGSFFWYTIVSGPCILMLPFALQELWRMHEEISFGNVKTWQVENEELAKDSTIYLNGVPVRFKIIQEPFDESIGTIQFMASGRMILSRVFHDMVQKQKRKGLRSVSLISREMEPYSWIFFTRDKFLINYILDPDLSLKENGISKNAVIYVQRVSKEAFVTKNDLSEQNYFNHEN